MAAAAAAEEAREAAKEESDGSAAGSNPGTPSRRKSMMGTVRETKAMRAQREAAMKRRETLEVGP